MASNGKYRRVDIGFAHGQILAMRLQEDAYQKLHTALSEGSGERWQVLDAEDATVSVDVSQIVYVTLDTEKDRVGF